MPRNWTIPKHTDEGLPLLNLVGGYPLVARLLAQRGIRDAASALAFLDPTHYTPSLPFVLPDMQAAVDLLRECIACGEKIRIWGDFDADGQTSTAVLYEALLALGAQVDYRLPQRREGHGLPVRAIEEAVGDGVVLLLTCDTGIGENEAIERGIALGLKVVVTDHHDLPEVVAPAHVIVNPKTLAANHPLRELAGVGVAYMVARALLEGGEREAILESLLDLVAVGLVADMAGQVGEVRYLIQRGLPVLQRAARPGLRALMMVAGDDPATADEVTIGYHLGPRLNSAGRLADATWGLRLLLTQDEREAWELAEYLENLNRDRQARTEALSAEVEELLRQNPDILHQPAIVLEGEEWEPGILGLVAGDLVDRYGRPAILIAHLPDQPSAGSARSVAGIDIHDAITSQREHLVREGGHPMAAGFGIERDQVPAFRAALLEQLAQVKAPSTVAPHLMLHAEVDWKDVHLDLCREMARLAPFGQGNPNPVLMLTGGTLYGIEDVSRRRETAHRHLRVDDDLGHSLRVTWFNVEDLPPLGERLDIAFHLSVGRWYGVERPQLRLVDWRLASVSIGQALRGLVAEAEIVDWRSEPGARRRLADLQAAHGDELVIWAEGADRPMRGAVTRADLVGRRAEALAVLTPPPDLEALRWVLDQLRPHLIYLFPPEQVSELYPNQFLSKVTSMLRVAMRARKGATDTLDMAAELGVSRSAVVVSLRGLEARGKLVLHHASDGSLYAYRPEEAPPDARLWWEEENSPEDKTIQLQRARDQSRDALMSLLKQTRAYRGAYTTQPIATLFGNREETT